MASPAINVYSIISPQTLWPPLPYPFPLFICPHYSSSPPIQASRFFRLKPLAIYSTYPFRFRPSFQSPRSIFSQKSQLSDVDEDEDEDEDEDDDDDVAAEEYDSDALGILEQSYEEVELSMEATEISTAPEEFKWQRVEKLLGEVKEFGEGIIDVDELASVYNFRIDKFQRLAIQAFLRGSSVVVSAPTSSGKTLIAEAAAVATVARKRRLFYTTPLKALSNQKFREFRETFGDSNVGLLTGDSAVNKDALVLIMTTEILRNMLYQR